MNVVWKRAVAMAVVVACLTACTSGSGPDTTSDVSTTFAPTSTTSVTAPLAATPSPNVEIGSSGVAVALTDAVAPYNHETWVEHRIFGMRWTTGWSRVLEECLETLGVTLDRALGGFDRSDPYHMNWTRYQNYEWLIDRGFPYLFYESDQTRGMGPRPDQGGISALVVCQPREADRFAIQYYEVWLSARVGWQEVEIEVEALPEMQEQLSLFDQCLRAEGGLLVEGFGDAPGITGRITEQAYVDYVDSLLGPHSERESNSAILRDYGIFYAECGKDLWETRERLLLERRDTMLAEHIETLRELHVYLYGPLP